MILIKNNSFNSNIYSYIKDMGIGINIGNSLDAYNNGIPSETAWGNPIINKELLESIKKAGFRTIRCPISWLKYIDDNNNYKINENWLLRIKEIINWIEELGLYIIINIHHDGNNDFNNGAWLSLEQYPYENTNWNNSGYDIKLNQDLIREKYKKVWLQIANYFNEFSDKLIFESANELGELNNYDKPIASTTIPNLNYLNQLFVDTIRSTGGNNYNRLLIIAGYNTNLWITTKDNGFIIPNDIVKNKIMVSIHYYDPWNYTLNENNDNIYKWGDEIYQLGDIHTDNWGGESYIKTIIDQLKNEFLDKNIPILIGELGAINKSNVDINANEYRRYFLEYLVNSLYKNNNIIPIYWDNGDNNNYGFALFDRKNGNIVQPLLVKSIIRNKIIDNKVRYLYSREILEDMYNIFFDKNYDNNDQKWIDFKSCWYNTLASSEKYKNEKTLNNLTNIESYYKKLWNLSNNLLKKK